MTALAETNHYPVARAPGALATTLRRWRRIVRGRRVTAGRGEYALKLFGAPRGDDPEIARLFLRYPPI